MVIKHLRNNTINYELWDDCISHSHNHLPYAYTWYLDIVSPGWEALVTENYDYIMPLPTKSKFNIPYLVQPILTQQLGIFSKHEITNSVVEEFIKEIPYFSYELNLNEHNICPKALIFPNLMLSLDKTYSEICANYSNNTLRNIEKAKKKNLTIKENISPNDFLTFYYSVDKHFVTVSKSLIENLIEKGLIKKSMKLFGVFNIDNQMVAGLCILKSLNRLTYLLPVSNSEGKSSSAMFLLIDSLIRKEAEKNLFLDFEGSQIDGIARFYRGFGAKNHPYYILKKFRPSFLVGK